MTFKTVKNIKTKGQQNRKRDVWTNIYSCVGILKFEVQAAENSRSIL